MERKDITAGRFTLATSSRITDVDAPINVYIEGDGIAWRSRYQVSPDPTPHKAIGFELAKQDMAANVVYIARPCQYRDLSAEACPTVYWTNKRFSEEVIDAIDSVISSYSKHGNGEVALTGYSGGAAVAVLVAARRHDVISLRTVAGNLDHVALNQYHKVSPMPDSLNAMDATSFINIIPQLHFIGEQDQIVPAFIAENFVTAVGSECGRLIREKNVSHDEGWVERWTVLSTIMAECRKSPN